MAQHFLLTANARTLSLATVLRMTDDTFDLISAEVKAHPAGAGGLCGVNHVLRLITC